VKGKIMNENVFRRVEQKYLLTPTESEQLMKKIEDYIECDEYFESTICNIYFDNNHNDLIVASLEKPTFKVKIRLRSYNIPDLPDKVFLEIKDKYRGIVGKRRIKMTLKDFYDYLNTGSFNDKQIMKEIDYYFKKYNLKPYAFVAYDRKSYRGRLDKFLRITFDRNLRSRYEDLRLELGDAGERYFKDNMTIMEIKALDAMPLWLARSLSELKIFPTSFSKVGNIYKKRKIKERSENLC